MALFRRFFYRKPPDHLLEISERVYVFDCCFSTDILDEREYKTYMDGIVPQLRDFHPNASFMVCNFQEVKKRSQISEILSGYDMTVMDYPWQYEGCSILPLEIVFHLLKSSESWLSLSDQQNVLLMYCERGGWPVLAFILAGVLLFRKQYNGEQKTLEMVYKQAPREILQIFSPLNPQPSQLRYLQYITRRSFSSEWPPTHTPLALDCIILRVLPLFDGGKGCRPVVRVYGQHPFSPVNNKSSGLLFSTPRTKKHARFYSQEECMLVKVDVHCHVQGDVVLECMHLNDDLAVAEMMLRVVFHTSFIRSNVLMLSRDEVDVIWDAKDQFPKDFKAEVLFSDADSVASITAEIESEDEDESASPEEFFEAEEIFSNIIDGQEVKGNFDAVSLEESTQGNDIGQLSWDLEPNAFQDCASDAGNQKQGQLNAEFSASSAIAVDKVNNNFHSKAEDGDQYIIKETAPIVADANHMPDENETRHHTEQSAVQEKIESKDMHLNLGADISKQKSDRQLPSTIPEKYPTSNSEPANLIAVEKKQTPQKSCSSHVTQAEPLLVSQSCGNLDIACNFSGSPVHTNAAAEANVPSPPCMNSHFSVYSTKQVVSSSIQTTTNPVSDEYSKSFPLHCARQTQNTIPPPPPPPPPQYPITISCSLSGRISSPLAPDIKTNLASLCFPLEPPHTKNAVPNSNPKVPLLFFPPSPPPPPPPPPFPFPLPSCRPLPISSTVSHTVLSPRLSPTLSPHSISSTMQNISAVFPPPPPPPPWAAGSTFSDAVLVSSFLPPPPPPPLHDQLSAQYVPLSHGLPSPPPPPPLPRAPYLFHSFPVPDVPPPSAPTMHGAPSPPIPTAINGIPPPPPPPPPPPIDGATSPPPSQMHAAPRPPPPSPPPTIGAPSLTPAPPPSVYKAPPPPPPPIHRAPHPPPLQQNVTTPSPPHQMHGAARLPPSCRAPPPPPRAQAPGPPPPPGAPLPPGGAPPPPRGLPSARGRGLSRSNASAIKKSTLKPLHWSKVTRALQGSLWEELQRHGDPQNASEFDVSELEKLFSATVPKSSAGGKTGGQRKSDGPKSDRVHLIDLRRANNTEIMLTKVKMPLSDMMAAALAMDESILDADQVDNLIKFSPTKEEMELLKGYTGDKDKLGKCEQYFLELMKVPRVEHKLRVFLFKIQFNSQISDLKGSLNTVNSVCDEVRNSLKLKEIMKKILYLGNTLNQGTARGSAVGFKLDSLLKLTDTRASNNKMTLMHYLCKVLASKSSHLLDFCKDLGGLEAASKIQLKSLAEEMQAITRGLEKVKQELVASENDGPVSEIFCKTLKEFVGAAEKEAVCVTNLYSAVGRNADALALYFGEDPARCPFEQVTATLLNFVRLFRKAHEENCKQAELEKKKAQKEVQTEKAKEANTSKNIVK